MWGVAEQRSAVDFISRGTACNLPYSMGDSGFCERNASISAILLLFLGLSLPAMNIPHAGQNNPKNEARFLSGL
jgi:hypothetical protein